MEKSLISRAYKLHVYRQKFSGMSNLKNFQGLLPLVDNKQF